MYVASGILIENTRVVYVRIMYQVGTNKGINDVLFTWTYTIILHIFWNMLKFEIFRNFVLCLLSVTTVLL